MKAELLILGVLHRGDFHPYEIKRRLTNAMVECFTDVDVGTLYYAIRQLAAKKLIVAVSREKVSRGGTRTIYRITPKGRERFQDLLNEQFAAAGSVPDTLYTAMLFLHLADIPRATQFIRDKLERQARLIEETKSLKTQLKPVLSTGGHYLLDHIELQRRLDQRWMRSLLSDLEAGKIEDVPDPRRLGQSS
jgi:DNA-binding PadR family transcriptional regulator